MVQAFESRRRGGKGHFLSSTRACPTLRSRCSISCTLVLDTDLDLVGGGHGKGRMVRCSAVRHYLATFGHVGSCAQPWCAFHPLRFWQHGAIRPRDRNAWPAHLTNSARANAATLARVSWSLARAALRTERYRESTCCATPERMPARAAPSTQAHRAPPPVRGALLYGNLHCV